jgi:tetratricopeptide (TPR) repeat protein
VNGGGGVQPPPGPAPVARNHHPEEEVDRALRGAEADIQAGRFDAARLQLARFEPGRVAVARRASFTAARDRAERLAALLRETHLTATTERPKLSTLKLKASPDPVIGTVLAATNERVELRRMDGTSADFEGGAVESVAELDPAEAGRALDAEIDSRDRKVRPGQPLDAFRLGEFCLKNGRPDRVAECFDRAFRMAAESRVDLLAAVRAEKAAGLYDTFLFFLSINRNAEAASTLELLRFFHKDSPLIAKAESIRPDMSLDLDPRPVRAAAGPGGTPADYRSLVERADASYDKALAHLQRSDPGENPTGWEKENVQALGLLEQAVDLYNQSLDIQNDRKICDRVRDANFKRVLCRKRMTDKTPATPPPGERP